VLNDLSMQIPLDAPLMVEGEKDKEAREGYEGSESRETCQDALRGVGILEVQVVEAELELQLVWGDVEDVTRSSRA
jgi:hypothetical protein